MSRAWSVGRERFETACRAKLVLRGVAMTGTAQAMEALNRANTIRVWIADVKREIRAGTLTIPLALDDPRAQRMRALDLLLAVPHVGPLKARKMLRAAEVSDAQRVGDLTNRQCMVLAAWSTRRERVA